VCGEQRKAEGIIILGRERKGQQTLALSTYYIISFSDFNFTSFLSTVA
jgi:hypothetical protein